MARTNHFAEAGDLRALLLLMREQRAVRVKLPNGTEVELSPLAFALGAEAAPEQPAPIGLEHGGEPTEAQLLEWSAPGPLPRAEQPEVIDG